MEDNKLTAKRSHADLTLDEEERPEKKLKPSIGESIPTPTPTPTVRKALCIISDFLSGIQGISSIVVSYTSLYVYDFVRKESWTLEISEFENVFKYWFPNSLSGAVKFSGYVEAARDDMEIVGRLRSDDITEQFDVIPARLARRLGGITQEDCIRFIVNLFTRDYYTADTLDDWTRYIIHRYGSEDDIISVFWLRVIKTLAREQIRPTLENIACFWVLFGIHSVCDTNPIVKEYMLNAAKLWSENPRECTKSFLSATVNVEGHKTTSIQYIPIHYYSRYRWQEDISVQHSTCPKTFEIEESDVPDPRGYGVDKLPSFFKFVVACYRHGIPEVCIFKGASRSKLELLMKIEHTRSLDEEANHAAGVVKVSLSLLEKAKQDLQRAQNEHRGRKSTLLNAYRQLDALCVHAKRDNNRCVCCSRVGLPSMSDE